MKRRTKREVKKKEENLFKIGIDFVKESRNYIYFSVIIFVVSAIIGFYFSNYFTFIDEILKELVNKTEGLESFELVSFIFWNNLQSAFIGMIFGIVFGIMPVINAITNGVVLGYVFDKVYKVSGFADFWRILPHGIFELPAVFIALGMGIKLGSLVFSGNYKDGFLTHLKKAFYAFVFVVIPLLVIAAIIEGLLIGLGK